MAYNITAENASELAKLGVAARKAKAQAAREAAILAASLPPASPVVDSQLVRPDEFTAKRLTRVRKQLDMIDALIESEIDPNKLDRLASASIKLSELARVLKGDPLPGSLRPTKASSRRAPGGPVVPE